MNCTESTRLVPFHGEQVFCLCISLYPETLLQITMFLDLTVNAVQQQCRLDTCHVQYNVNEYNYLQIFIIISVTKGANKRAVGFLRLLDATQGAVVHV